MMNFENTDKQSYVWTTCIVLVGAASLPEPNPPLNEQWNLVIPDPELSGRILLGKWKLYNALVFYYLVYKYLA